ncbi:MAG TPA: glucokinase [Polyangia bacterium]|nr:glucokinase [Polyangia bacterium]
MTVLAGDIGGTNSRLALYQAAPRAGDKPLYDRTYPSASQSSFDDIAETFLAAASTALDGRVKPSVASACFAIAGPIENNICRATNLPWVVDGRSLSNRLGVERVRLVNDFYAAALGVTALSPDWRVPLGGAAPVRRGPIAVLGAGTGLGTAFLLWSTAENGYQVIPSEGGHMDFGPRTPLETGLLQFLTNKYGRVSCERVLSGRGLVDVFAFLSQEPGCRALIRPETQAALSAPDPARDPAAVISERGLSGADPICEMSLAVFCSVLGAVAGNLALTILPTGGLFVVGGIAPRVLPYLQKGVFREAFDRKGRLHTLIERLPAFVVTHPQVGLIGAAAAAVGS